jgi:tetratricopeptide (TPR) repeat protein
MKAVNRENRIVIHGKNKFIPRLILVCSIVAFLTVATIISYHFINKYIKTSASVVALYDKWHSYDYQGVYDTAGRILNKKPLHNTARTFRGYSAFFLAVSQTDNTQAQTYLDDTINNLRVALQSAKKSSVGQIEYMLGKAYFYKDSMSSYYYYADLAVKYLLQSISDHYKAVDTSEYLGLSYAALGKTQESIAAFTEALLVRESDTLLMAIAEQYCKSGMGSASKQYLYRVNKMSKNEDIIMKSHLLLGQIYTDEGNLDDAQKEFDTILEKNENSADAHYGLGVLYEKQGDLVKARAEWRKCLRIQVNHPGAVQKMSDNK